jgi:hypothetical protein
MAVVAVVAMTLGVATELTQRRTRFLQLAAYHRSQIIAPGQFVDHNRRVVLWIDLDGGMLKERPRLDYWHEELAHNYQAAASRPWYPVEPDPAAPRPGESLSIINKKTWPDPFAPARPPSKTPRILGLNDR